MLRTFTAAADAGNFTKAAKSVNRTQSAVSMQIKLLEERVGCLLFRREGRGVLLTGEGRTLLEYARRLVSLHDEAVASVSTREISGRIRVGGPEDFASQHLPNMLARFGTSFPQVTVEMECRPSGELLRMLHAGDLDVAVCTEGGMPAQGELLHREQVVWIVSERHAPYEQDPLPLAVFHEGCTYRRWAVEALDALGREYRIAYSSPSVAGITAAVRSGLAVAPMGRSMSMQGCRRLRPEEGFPPLPAAYVTLHERTGARTPVVEHLKHHIRCCFNEELL